MSKRKILKIEKLKKHFIFKKNKKNKTYIHALDEIDLSIYFGETLGLVGESGSGKSTLGNIIIGIYYPTSGRILFKEKNIGMHYSKRPLSLKREIQVVFQNPSSSLNPMQTVEQIISLPIRIHTQTSKRQIRDKVAMFLEKVELSSDYLFRSSNQISGGEKQRVAIARAIVMEPSLIILDEPTSALDVSVQAKIVQKLMNIKKEMNLTYLFISHDISLLRNVVDRIAVMYLGKVVEIFPIECFKEILHPYTKMLISSTPIISNEEQEFKPKNIFSVGEIPSPINIPQGCSFHPRCCYKNAICSQIIPEMVEVSPGHQVKCHLFSK